jgi:RimJ/RimL family protein N-acetyltransferase
MTDQSRLVRELEAADAEAYREVRLEALRLHPEAFGSSYEVEVAESLDRFRDRLGKGGRFGGFVDGRLAGMAGYFRQEAARMRHKGVLVGMYVRASERGSGLADEIVNAVIAHARSRVEILQLSVATTNERALRLYQRMGFATYATERRALKIDGRYIDEFLMVRFF